MRTPEEDKAKFNESVGILVKAYLNGSLQHGNPCACAVGNMIAGSMGIKYTLDTRNRFVWDIDVYPQWFFGTESQAQNELDAVGYCRQEIMNIESAFESATNDEDGYKGLMSVLDVLAEIHNIDLKAREEAKTLFVRP